MYQPKIEETIFSWMLSYWFTNESINDWSIMYVLTTILLKFGEVLAVCDSHCCVTWRGMIISPLCMSGGNDNFKSFLSHSWMCLLLTTKYFHLCDRLGSAHASLAFSKDLCPVLESGIYID